jgi:predicted RNA-binding Zn-ribbon protein involved in translation (DUF1610 family)
MTEMTEFQRVDKARHRGYHWRCTECNKTFDYAAPLWDKAPNVRAVSPIYCPECGARDFVRSAKLVVSAPSNDVSPTAPDWMMLDDAPPEPEPEPDDVYYGPCSVCGDTTSWACSVCGGTGVSVYVCDKGACQRAHERTHKAEEEA